MFTLNHSHSASTSASASASASASTAVSPAVSSVQSIDDLMTDLSTEQAAQISGGFIMIGIDPTAIAELEAPGLQDLPLVSVVRKAFESSSYLYAPPENIPYIKELWDRVESLGGVGLSIG